MEYADILKNFSAELEEAEIADVVSKAKVMVKKNMNTDVFKRCYACIDLTSLESSDSQNSIAALAHKVAGQRAEFPNVPDVASVCVYPSFVETVGVELGDSDIRISSVAGGFPSSQTFLEVKMLEAAMAVENGADEIDIVINVGEILTGEFDKSGSELEILRNEVGEEVTLKVIIESGILSNPSVVRTAAITAMLAGADFVKTSTGKASVSATPEAAVVICGAIRDYYKKTGEQIGFKVAGGIRSAHDAALYYGIVESVLGEEWLKPALFRIGASSLANELLSAIEGTPIVYY